MPPTQGYSGIVRALRSSDRTRRSASILGCCAVLVLGFSGCGASSNATSGNLDPTPEKLDGTSSTEFEADDLERAENASEAVQEYCGDVESEAQRLGCLSHVDESDIP